jgi:hypothetical protein
MPVGHHSNHRVAEVPAFTAREVLIGDDVLQQRLRGNRPRSVPYIDTIEFEIRGVR